MIPFENAVLTVKVKGEVLLKMKSLPESVLLTTGKVDPAKDYVLATTEYIYFGGDAIAVGVGHPGRDDVELSIRPLLGDHPLDDVVGFTAPKEWWAFPASPCAVAPPRCPVTPAATGPEADGPTPLRMVHLQPRQAGRSVTLLDLDGLHEAPGPGQSGRMVDAADRVLGRRTAPPQVSARLLAEVVWVDRLLRLVIEDGCTRPDPATIRRLHRRARDASGDHRVRAVAGWSEPRTSATRWRGRRGEAPGARGSRRVIGTVLGVAPDVAAWMERRSCSSSIHGELPPMRRSRRRPGPAGPNVGAPRRARGPAGIGDLVSTRPPTAMQPAST